MNMIVIVILILMLMFSVIGGVIFFAFKKLDPHNGDKSEDPNIKTMQEFLPFEDIRDNTIILSNHKYRAIIECSATNYNLKTPAERALIEASFQQFLNTITFPITFFIQTKVIDNSKRLQLLREEIQATLQEFPNMTEYAEQYERDMSDLNTKIGNSQQKKRYIIIPYDEVIMLDNLTEDEKIAYAAKEIRSRCNIVMSNLEAVGVISHILDSAELIELVYSCYNRDDYSYAEALSGNEAFATFVNGQKDQIKNMPKEAVLDIILAETINKMELGNVETSHDGAMVLQEIKELREKYAGYHMQDKRRAM